MNEAGSGDEDDLGASQFETLIENARRIEGGGEHDDYWRQLQLERFELIRKLGQGGMGLVFLARQLRPVEREVALKLIRRRVFDAENRARFEVERQALARMQHPYIAQVFDAGTTADGHPWFAMEYVDGVPLDRFCREQRLSLEARLRLFIRMCQGVEHAHQKGIIHRDLKPANILVGHVDGSATPKIIDFGIATGVGNNARDRSEARIGTPHYMSPEQFRQADAGIDTRSDVYSLGVILYELLVDQPPIPSSSFSGTLTLSEMATAFQHRQYRPSEMLAVSGTPGDAIAQQRGTSLRRLRRRLKNDLDAVAMKALALAPEGRYAAAGDLAADVERALRHQPVEAVPPRAIYRARKFIRRHALSLGSASAILLALIAGLTAATLGMFEAQRQFQIAEQRQQELEKVTRFQQALLEEIDPQDMGEGILQEFRHQWQSGLERDGQSPELAEQALDEASRHVNATDLARQTLNRFVLERAISSVDREFAGQAGLKADLYRSIFGVYLAIDFPDRLPDLAGRIVRYREEASGPDALPTLNAEVERGWAHYLVNDLEQAERILKQIVLRFDPNRAEHREALIEARNHLATVQVDRGQLEAAIKLMSDNAAQSREWLGPDHEITIRTSSSAGFVHARARNFEQGLDYFQDALAAMRRTLDPQDPRLGRALLNVASSLGQLGRQAEALEIDHEVVAFFSATEGRRSTDTLRAMNNMANNLAALERLEEATRLLIETSELATEALGSAHPVTLRTRLNLGSILARQDRREEAQAIIEEVVASRLALLGPQHQETLGAQEVLANIMIDRGLAAEGLSVIEPVVLRRQELFGAHHPQTLFALHLQGRALLATGQYREAEAPTALAVQHFHERLGPEHRLTLASALNWYRIQLALNQPEAAARIRTDFLAPLHATDAAETHPDLRLELTALEQP